MVSKGADRAGGDPAPAKSRNRQHPRIVPAVDEIFVHELDELALAHHRVGKIEPREFDLARHRRPELERLQNPFVERPVYFELKCAKRVSDSFDVVAQGVGPIVTRLNSSLVAGMMMVGVAGS